MNYDRPELRDRLASEYVLGTLHGRARKRFQRLIRVDLKTRIAVEEWERRIMPMAAPLSMPAPSIKVWDAIEKRIAPSHRVAPTTPGFFARWFQWNTLTSLAAGVVLGMGAILIAKTQVETPGPIATAKMQLPESYAGFLQDNQGATRVLISSLRHGKVVDIKWLRPLELGTEQTLQLWALAKDAPPIALGSIPAQGKGNITMKDTSEVLLSKVTELAITVELKSGAPVSAPSGSFVLRGPCAKFW